MIKIKRIFYLATCLLTLNFMLFAAEGMYPPDQIPPKIKGLKIKPANIYQSDGGGLAGAVLLFGGGTGSFVSADGLVLTNHHVAFSAIQKNSTDEQNYLDRGFYARTKAEELPAPGYEASLMIGFEDVTEKILKSFTPQMAPEERTRAVEQAIAQLEAESEDSVNGLSGKVVSMLDGASYYLYHYRKFRDIRLVYAPPRSIGNFGGEVDNWMWPRHTGDFSFMRVYCAPDGKPAEYSEKNVPYQPKIFLPISTKGLNPDDLVFILGYPGRTYRNATSFSIAYNQNLVYPLRIRIFQKIINELEDESQKSPAIDLLLASRLKDFYNGLKNNQGLLAGFKSENILEQKKQVESELARKIAGKPDWQKQYGNVLPEIQKAYDEYYTGFERDMYINYLRYVTVLADALTIEKWSREKTKPESAREYGFFDYQMARTKRNFKARRIGYYAPADARILKLLLNHLAELPTAERPAFLHELIQDQPADSAQAVIAAYVDSTFTHTRLTDADECLVMFDLSAESLLDRQDPLITLAAAVNRELERIEKDRKEFSGKMLILQPQYFAALKNVMGKQVLPDANRSLRFTYGNVEGYQPRDAVIYQPQTTLAGVIAKHSGVEPFDVPEKLIELATRRDYGRWIDLELNDISVNFLSSCDITGGNSGSPVLNARGELVGCAFDGNWEALTNDWQYNPALSRAISVDILYILFILDKYSSAGELIEELDLR
ncbi:MAG TPA: S46 family peptidase [Candidatus Marinimicrobia bacterium]|nr:S46 family peptidase [Candidatus Neomarinimicrobiota bacterium]HRS50885.1 S46 family peptidase [Candidatus Neomarinimicrobiota bacterium]HRU91773.1 S46 family peptidase [Candidatus Neomarinimicrobiota bacterium]